MKFGFRILSFLSALVLLCSFASCSYISSIVNPGGAGQKLNEPVYTAVYDLNYDGQKNVVSYISSEGYIPQPPSRPGYEFRYWTFNGTPVDGVIPVGYTGNVTMVAEWKMVTYRLIYENLTEEEAGSMPKTFTVEDEVVIPDPERLGYRFLGWNTELQTDLVLPAGQTGDCVLYANWASIAIESFSASSNVEGISVSTSFEDQLLKFGTVVHASAPIYQNDCRFVRWEMNGTPVCTSAIYTFPLSKARTDLQAIYEKQVCVEWAKGRGASLTVFDLLSEKPGLILGAGIREGDYSFTETGVTLKSAFLDSLNPGDYSFLAATLSEAGKIAESRTFTLRLSGKATAPAGYAGLPEDGEAYLYKYISYRGETLPLVASTDEEFAKLVEYSVLVGGVLQLQKEGKTTGEYELKIYIWGDLNRRLQAGESILANATSSVSFPMNPNVGFSSLGNDTGSEVTLTVSYQKGLNDKKSTQTTSVMPDRQGLLTSKGREEGFEAFPIDALTETAKIQTLYELEVLPFGKKPEFASTAADAEEIYQIARGILRKIIDNGMTDYEKVKAIYSWLGLNLTYDRVSAANPNANTSSAYTIKGAFVDRLAVCDGYASAFRLLCQIEGIRAEEVIGLKQLNDPYSGHAWNKVWIGGAIFGVDCTWARQSVGSGEIVSFSYLFLDEPELILWDHYENASSEVFWVKDLANASVFLPATTAIDAFGHTFVVGSDADLSALSAYLKKNRLGAAEFYVAGGAPELHSTMEYVIYESESGYGYLVLT